MKNFPDTSPFPGYTCAKKAKYFRIFLLYTVNMHNRKSTRDIIAAFSSIFRNFAHALTGFIANMNINVNENKQQVRNRVIGMLLAGSTQKSVANKLGKDIRTVQRW